MEPSSKLIANKSTKLILFLWHKINSTYSISLQRLTILVKLK